MSFDPRARMGRDDQWGSVDYGQMFRSTRPHGARPGPMESGMMDSYWFRSTRPHGARPGPILPEKLLLMFRSTRPHGARLGSFPLVSNTLMVSIHAPAWGATIGMSHTPVGMEVSIHAPAWGATRRCALSRQHHLFRSTRPHGARHSRPFRHCHKWLIGEKGCKQADWNRGLRQESQGFLRFCER